MSQTVICDTGYATRFHADTVPIVAGSVSYTHLIVNEGLKADAAGMNPMDLKRGIDKAVLAAVEELKALSVPCSDSKAIAQVGTCLLYTSQ